MKKSTLFIAAGVLALSACTSTEVLEEGVHNKNVIGFENHVSKESRALTTAGLSNFYVYGYYVKNGFTAAPVGVFNGREVYKNEGGKWTYNDTRYWVPNATYFFYAYSCDNNSVSSVNGTPAMSTTATNEPGRALRISGYICNSNDNHQHDLVYASATNVEGGGKDDTTHDAVAFNFKHILSKVNVKFESGFAAGYNIKISNVKIVNIKDKGNYAPNNGWTGQARTMTEEGDESYINLPIEGNNIASAKDDKNEAKTVTTAAGYVIPGTYEESDAGVWLEFTIEVTNPTNGHDVEVTSTTLYGSWNPTWELGKSYTYNVKITGGEAGLVPIVFTTATDMNLDSWADGNEAASKVEMNFNAN